MGGMDWIDLAQDRDRWRALKAVMNLRVSYNAGYFLTVRACSLLRDSVPWRKKERKVCISGGWRKVHNEELCSLYYSQDFVIVGIKS
jgi:hypothetical protein